MDTPTLSSFTKGAPTVADTGKFSVLPRLRRRELHLSSLNKEHPLAGDRAAFPRRRSARMVVEACAWADDEPRELAVNRGKPRDGDGSSSRAACQVMKLSRTKARVQHRNRLFMHHDRARLRESQPICS